MAEMNDDRFELLERQLTEKVTLRVRSALFRLYAAVGVAVIGVLGFVGWDMVSEIKSDINTSITTSISNDIKTKQNEIAELVTETRFMAKRANQVIQRLEKQLDEFQPQAESLNETIEKVTALNLTARNLLTVYSQDVEPLVSNVDSLSNQLRTLAKQVNQLNAIVADGRPAIEDEPLQTQTQRTAAIQTVISDTEQAKQQFNAARRKTVVFFQFTGGQREQAEELSASLEASGYNVPGEDREYGARGKHEIRYFHREDENAARHLARDTNAALQKLGYVDRRDTIVQEISYEAYAGKKPLPGVVELWLDFPPR